jgi:hypothetical protein
MRLNLPLACPSCGFLGSISETQAIEAHRLLERLEFERKEPRVE